MLGSYERPKFKLQGAETNGVLEFSVFLIQRHSEKLPRHVLWTKAATYLVRLKNLIKEHPYHFPASATQDMTTQIATQSAELVQSLHETELAPDMAHSQTPDHPDEAHS